MTFTEAENKLKEIANGRYHALAFEKSNYSSGRSETDCRLYIADEGWHSGHTWDEAFCMLENKGFPVEQNPEAAA